MSISWFRFPGGVGFEFPHVSLHCPLLTQVAFDCMLGIVRVDLELVILGMRWTLGFLVFVNSRAMLRKDEIRSLGPLLTLSIPFVPSPSSCRHFMRGSEVFRCGSLRSKLPEMLRVGTFLDGGSTDRSRWKRRKSLLLFGLLTASLTVVEEFLEAERANRDLEFVLAGKRALLDDIAEVSIALSTESRKEWCCQEEFFVLECVETGFSDWTDLWIELVDTLVFQEFVRLNPFFLESTEPKSLGLTGEDVTRIKEVTGKAGLESAPSEVERGRSARFAILPSLVMSIPNKDFLDSEESFGLV